MTPSVVDDEQRPLAHPLVAVDAVRARDVALRLEVGEQREVQLAALRERHVAPGAVDGDADELRAEPLELGQDLVVERHLVAADRAPVGRIEREDQPLAAKSPSRTVWSGVDLSSNSGAGVPAGKAPFRSSVGSLIASSEA